MSFVTYEPQGAVAYLIINRMRVHRRGAAALFAAFDLGCFLRPLPLCGEV